MIVSSVLGIVTFFLALAGGFVVFLWSIILGLLFMAPCAAYFYWIDKRRGAFTDQVSALRRRYRCRTDLKSFLSALCFRQDYAASIKTTRPGHR